MIYMNGKAALDFIGEDLVLMENIFDAVNPGRPDLWHTVQAEQIGRPINDILSEWVNEHRTYYYLNGVKTIFESRHKDNRFTVGQKVFDKYSGKIGTIDSIIDECGYYVKFRGKLVRYWEFDLCDFNTEEFLNQ
ncbi:MAG: hypothetical protein RR313_10990 [Anaerovoracaceae bacterium]